ncbi:MAG: hypothetical protein WBY53_00900 [Acidobacteriaceae bacterium]
MSLVLDQSAAPDMVRVRGEIRLVDAAESRQVLLDALALGKTVEISLNPEEELSLAALQLLVAAEREAYATGVEYHYADGTAESVSRARAAAGMPLLGELVATL